MDFKRLLTRKGIFTRLDHEGGGVDVYNSDYTLFWRRVLDEVLLGMLGTNTSAVDAGIRYFNAGPNDIETYIDVDTGVEISVNSRDEFHEVCSLANLDHELVRSVANSIYEEYCNGQPK